MARIKLGAIISDIRGTLQNGVYSLAKGGVHYVKNIPASVNNPHSEDQALVRSTIQVASKRWYDTLTADQRNGWNELAQVLSGLAKEGNGGVLSLVPPIGMDGSGLNAYVGFFTRSAAAGLIGSFSDDAPIGETQPTPPAYPSASYDGLTGYLTVNWTDPATADAGAKIAVWVASHQKIYHKQIVAYNDLLLLTDDIAAARGAKGKWIPFQKTKPFEMIIQLQTVNPSGWASPGCDSVEVVCA